MTQPTVVLVHGAFADASSWSGVITELLGAGINVVAPPNPLRGLTPDAAYITAVVDQIEGPILLVGHSYGGAVITKAGTDAANVVGLVFVAAFALEENETVMDVNGRYPDVPIDTALAFGSFPIDGADPGTELSIDPAKFHESFCADVPAATAAVMAASQRPVALEAFATPLAGTPGGRPSRHGSRSRRPTTRSTRTRSGRWPSAPAVRRSRSSADRTRLPTRSRR